MQMIILFAGLSAIALFFWRLLLTVLVIVAVLALTVYAAYSLGFISGTLLLLAGLIVAMIALVVGFTRSSMRVTNALTAGFLHDCFKD